MSKISISLRKYKGVVLADVAKIECTMQKLVGDCSGYNIGCIGAVNIYLLQKHRHLMEKLLVHKILNIQHFQPGGVDVTWCNKYVFSGPTDYFDSQGVFATVYETFLSVTKHKEQAITTRGWHGKDYDIRTATVPKSYRHHIPMEGIDWEGIDVSVVVTGSNGKALSDTTYTTMHSLDDEIKRHTW